MLLRLRNAATSMADIVHRQDRTANNLANANTLGYRRDRSFTEVLRSEIDAEGSPQSDRRTVGQADLVAGALDPTGNPLDVALGGEGFFVVDGPDGAPRYTRAGRFLTDADGTLRTANGAAVRGTNGPIRLPSGGPILITEGGEVTVGGQRVGTLQVVTFEDAGTLRRLDDTSFTSAAPPVAVAAPVVRQGFVEGSNVDPIREMADMIAHVRLYEAQQKTVQTTDAILGQVARDLGSF
ncbi:flagellar hook-basal body protein [Rubrivirga litoralis]|uniref:Flagellar hook-basal body protein n=1 Tax=Rubrivirga litoralis TaxID=3075598 RepID=A0ABU3BR52_9BACT|nr:flagellar hook-basal body protein [Rubrivirga sp. F394]MDT0631768.1 flagellar hook-basal body protein [Rubrivirga sp. F394]